MSDITVSGTMKEAGWDAAEKFKEIVQYELSKAINQIISHTKESPVGIAISGIPIGGSLKEAGWDAAEKVKDIVQHELSKAINQIIDHTKASPVGVAASFSGSEKAPPIDMKWTLGGGTQPVSLRFEPTTISPGLQLESKLFGLIPLLMVRLSGTVTLHDG